MMAQPNNPSVSVIGSQFIAPYPLEVKVETNSKGTLWITDINNKIILKVIPCDKSFHRQRLLMDADDRPIVTIEEKEWTAHKRWNVYRGVSTSKSDMIFTTKEKHMIQMIKTRVNVHLASSIDDAYDFKIKGNWHKRNCAIYKGYSSTALAQMHTVQQLQKKKLPKDKFMVTINPNVDYAFVVALITIVDAMESPYKNERVAAAENGFKVTQALVEFVGKLAGP